ncbi:M48 family metalloprotease [Streptomyces yunnanensis]|uniref:M48 family metalloprotease n=1 Tax=Streptomyces yunnanensis TaxID=156453 RepID=A0ABY8A2H4_9ACTN|nr:M48 family metalloprotease [Streptomyces yunnanensis]WEB39160.1 M48 family metalloprotease [Streptomyces yunnanensis]
MTTAFEPAQPGRTSLPEAPVYPAAVLFPSSCCPDEMIPPPPPYPGGATQSEASHSAGNPEQQSVSEKRVPQEALGRRGRVHLAKRQRGMDATAVGQLLLQLPSFLASLVIVVTLSHLLFPGMGWLGGLLWLASGAMAFHRPTERALARHVLNLRHPTPGELNRLAPLWREVAARTGVDGRAYELWIEESDHLNAVAAAGHIVGVTRFSLEHLSDGQLAAVLAHELGHHVRGHAWSLVLGRWYAAPVRFAWAAVRRLIRLVTVVGRGRMSFWAAVLLLAAGAIVLAVAWKYWFLTLTLMAAPYLLAAVTRRAELRADHHAVVAGFGPMLAEVLQLMQAAEREGGPAAASALSGCGKMAAIDPGTAARGGRRSLSGKLLSSHPDYYTRLHHLAPSLKRR